LTNQCIVSINSTFSDAPSENVDDVDRLDFGNIFDRLKEFWQFPPDFSFEDFLDADTNVAAEATLTDTDILEQVRQNA